MNNCFVYDLIYNLSTFYFWLYTVWFNFIYFNLIIVAGLLISILYLSTCASANA